MKLISHKTTSPPHRQFNRIHQVASMCIPSNTWFLGPIRVHIQNSISIGSVIFAGLTSVTDRPTKRQTMLVYL